MEGAEEEEDEVREREGGEVEEVMIGGGNWVELVLVWRGSR